MGASTKSQRVCPIFRYLSRKIIECYGWLIIKGGKRHLQGIGIDSPIVNLVGTGKSRIQFAIVKTGNLLEDTKALKGHPSIR